MAAKKKKEDTQKPEVVYTRQQLLQAKRYADRLDLINTLLKDGKSYSIQQVDEMIEKYMKGKVK